MTEERYNDLITYANRIGNFKALVASESKRPLAIRTLMYIAEISLKEATEFAAQFYGHMDVKFGNGSKVDNKFKKF